MKSCECGCGRAAPIAKQSDTARGYIKGEPSRFVYGHQWNRNRTSGVCAQCRTSFTAPNSAKRQFCSRECADLAKTGRERPRPKGGRAVPSTTLQYVRARAMGHNRATNGYVLEHILVAERALGKPLPRHAEVHHRDENKQNNDPGNLIICENAAYHRLIHLRTRLYRQSVSGLKRCSVCKNEKPFSEFHKSRRHVDGLGWWCRSCCVKKRSAS